MNLPTNPGADESRAQQSPIRVSGGHIHVMKVASMFGENAVAVDLTVRSDRTDQCDVQVTDVLPEAVRDNNVEFHPKYDPDHWTREADRVIYRAPIGPGVVRRTVYGVTVDDRSQLAAFAVEPTVEVIGGSDGTASGASGRSTDASAGDEFSFDEPATMTDSASDVGEAVVGADATEPRDGVTPGSDPTRDGAVGGFVAEVERRGLTRRERTVLRDALGLDADGDALESLNRALADVQDDIEALQAAMPAEGQAEDLGRVQDRLDALSEELESAVESLSADLDDLQATLDREVSWRAQLRRSIESGPEDP